MRPEEILEHLGEAIRDCDLIRTIPSGKRLFRARGHAKGETYVRPVDLGPPPKELATTAGRLNAPGIVVFYGAYEKDTAIAEASGEHSIFSVAEFETLTDIVLVDLTHLPRIPSIFESGPREALRFLQHFTEEVSRPFEPDAQIHLEYTPTQVVSEFFRHRLQDQEGRAIRGLVYESARCPGTANVTLFIGSDEIEGVSNYKWPKVDAVLRLILVKEAEASKSPPPL